MRRRTRRSLSRPSRLFLVVVVFLVLAGYAIWNSDRFQSLFQGVSEQRLSELLQRPVSFRRVDFTIFPPSVHLADVRVGNDPRAPQGPLLEAEELTIGGGVSVTGGELRFGRVRALHPKIALVQFPDGSWNLPPGLSRPASKGGLSVKIGELVVQSGIFEFEGRKSDIDGRLENFAAELALLPGNNYRGSLACRRTTLRLARRRAARLRRGPRLPRRPGVGPADRHPAHRRRFRRAARRPARSRT